MKKTNRMIAGVLAAVMGLASLPVLSASAAEAAYVQGDVDLDGVITGHDSAVVSRSLYVEGASLTEEQAKIADMDGDGVVDQTDLETIHAKEVYVIGDFSMKGNSYLPTAYDAWYSLLVCASESMGLPITVISVSDVSKQEILPADSAEQAEVVLNEVRYNLMDANGDGVVDYSDVYYILHAASDNALEISIYPEDGRYDLAVETEYKQKAVDAWQTQQ